MPRPAPWPAQTKEATLAPHPLVLDCRNFTAPARTPWGGHRLRARLPSEPGAPFPEGPLGELWCFSLDTAAPSRVLTPEAATRETLANVLTTDPEAWCGRGASSAGPSLLLKLLDAGDRLSLQVHPADDDPALPPGTSGKPEAWIVLEADPGAGLWLGLADGVGRADVEAALDAASRDPGGPDPLAPLLHFVPVAAGDAFVIGPGTVHAIGGGVTLLEPQLVRPGREGLTYRFWDWGRRYDAAGRPDPTGAPRPLHRDRALAVTSWDAPRGAAFEATCRRLPSPLPAPKGVQREAILTLGPVAVERLRAPGGGAVQIATDDALTVALPVAGALTLRDGRQALAGRACVVPAAAGAIEALLAPGSDLFVLREHARTA
jgi:mannose-6-phosphate isomerase class I